MDFVRKQLGQGGPRRLRWRIVISYILDYAILVFLFIVFQALDAVEPYHQHFALQNYTLQYPYAEHERVPIGAAIVISILAPLFIIALYTLVIDGIFSHGSSSGAGIGKGRNKYTLLERLWEFNCGFLGLLLSEGAAFVITGALKNATGKPRPDLIARCLPREGSADPPVFGLSNSTICTQTKHAILKDGFRSFPSGHSSSSFAGLFYLSLYLSGKLHILDSRGEVWKTFIVLVPTLGAALIAVSRIMDARHHPFDVISGGLLGILVAWGAYRQYFPPLSEPWHKGRAYPIRSWGTEPKRPRQQFEDASRDHSPVELLRMAGQPGVAEPEYGPAQLKPATVNAGGWRSTGRGEEGVYGGRAEGASGHPYDSSASTTDFAHTRPAAHGSTEF